MGRGSERRGLGKAEPRRRPLSAAPDPCKSCSDCPPLDSSAPSPPPPHPNPSRSSSQIQIAISGASYRGAMQRPEQKKSRENSRENTRKGCRRRPKKQPKSSRKEPQKLFWGCFGLFSVFFFFPAVFSGAILGTSPGTFSGVCSAVLLLWPLHGPSIALRDAKIRQLATFCCPKGLQLCTPNLRWVLSGHGGVEYKMVCASRILQRKRNQLKNDP